MIAAPRYKRVPVGPKREDKTMWTVEKMLKGCHGTFAGLRDTAAIAGFSIDTRTIRQNEVFIALRGPRFNGHDFVADAFNRGAIGAVVSRMEYERRPWERFLDRCFFIQVDDPLSGLQEMAIWQRGTFDIPVVGISGSNGKTTTKEMTAAILSRRGPVLKSEGNLNNHIGLPLCLLRLKEGDQAAVVEMGISQPGEMQRLCKMAQPTVAVITNVGPAHLEFLGDLAGVAREKGDLFRAVSEGGIAVINRDDPYLCPWEDHVSEKWNYAMNGSADVTASDVAQDSNTVTFTLHLHRGRGGNVPVILHTVGRHHIYNALAAATVSCALGYRLDEIREGLDLFRPLTLRTEHLVLNGVHVLLDAYNANPASMKAALEMLASYRPEDRKAGRKVALLGDMLELGESAPFWHVELGKWAGNFGVDRLICVGRWAEQVAEGARLSGMTQDAISTCPDVETVCLSGLLFPGDHLLIKGSRGMKMERILSALSGDG